MLGLPRAAGEVTRIIRGETSTDDDGFQTPAETQETLYGFLDIPTVSEPSHGAAEVDVAEATLYLQPGTAVDAKDLFLIDGTRFEVVGIAPVNRNVFTADNLAQAAGGQDMGYKVTMLALEDPRGAVSVMATGHAARHNRKHNTLIRKMDAARD